jgi:hypothetical protein
LSIFESISYLFLHVESLLACRNTEKLFVSETGKRHLKIDGTIFPPKCVYVRVLTKKGFQTIMVKLSIKMALTTCEPTKRNLSSYFKERKKK